MRLGDMTVDELVNTCADNFECVTCPLNPICEESIATWKTDMEISYDD